MNETGRLPTFAMLHIGMTVRFTQTVEDGVAVIDDTGTVIGIDFHEHELVQHKLAIEQASNVASFYAFGSICASPQTRHEYRWVSILRRPALRATCGYRY